MEKLTTKIRFKDEFKSIRYCFGRLITSQTTAIKLGLI